MANVKTTLVQFQNSAFSGNASAWRWSISTSYGGFAIAQNEFNTLRPAGTYSNLRGYVAANTNNNTSTLRFNNNGSNSNLVVSIPTTQTGAFEDITHTDTVVSGNPAYFTLTVVNGSTGTITFSLTQIDFLASSDTHTTLAAHGSAALSATSTTGYNALCATIGSTIATESTTQIEFKHSCTLRNFRIYVSADDRTGTTTHRVRKNGANGNQVISTSATGTFEDVTNTDTVVSGDKICFSTTTDSTAGGSITWTNMGVDVENTTNSIYPLPAAYNSQTFGVTRYECPSLLIGSTTTEANAQVKLYNASTLKNLVVNLDTNTVNGTSTVRMRKNAANANPVVSINASTSGFFYDDASTTVTAANDLVNFSVVTGGSSGSIGYGSIYVEAEVEIPPPNNYYTKVVSVASTGAATQDITFTPNSGDPTWTPKVAIFQWSRANTSADTFQEHASTGIGFTNGTTSRCVAYATEDNQARGDAARIQRNDALLCTLNPTGTVETVDSIATFNSWLSNGIRINWTDAPAANFYLTVLFLGGSDITNVDVGTLLTGTSTGDISETGLAYQPDFGLFLSAMTATDNAPVVHGMMSIGAATSSSAQWNQSILTQDNPVTMLTRQYYSHTKTVLSMTTAGVVDGYATFSSFNANGFTLNVADAFPASHRIFYLVIKGGQYAVGNNTEIGSVTTQTVTTNKFTKAVGIFGLDTGTADAPQNGNMQTIGFGDNALNQNIRVYEDTNGVADSVVVSRHDTNQIYLNITANATATSSTLDDEAALSAVSDTGFTLNWTNVGQARPYRYITFGKAIPLTSITKTHTQLWDIRKDITDTNTLIQNIIQQTIDTNTLKFDLLQPIAQDKVGTLLYHIRNDATKTNTIKWNEIQELTDINTLKLDIRNELTDTNTIRWQEFQDVLKQNSLRNDIRQAVTNTNTTIFNIIQEITDTNILIQDIRKELTDTNILIYDIRREIPNSKILTLLQDIRKQIEDTNTIRWDEYQELTKTNTFLFNLIQELVKIDSLLFDIDTTGALTPVTKTLNTLFYIRTGITKTNSLLQDIRLAQTKINTIISHIRLNVEQDIVTRFDMISQPVKPLTMPFNIRQEITAAKTLTLLFQIKKNVEKIRILLSDIRQELTPSKSITLLQHIAQDVLKLNTLLFSFRQELTKTNTILSDIQKETTKTSNLRFAILQAITDINTILFDIEEVFVGTVTKTSTLKFHVTQMALKTLTALFTELQQVIDTNTLNFDIRKETSKDNVLRFDIRYQLEDITTLLHMITTDVTKTETIPFRITALVSKTETLLQNISQSITKQLRNISNIEQQVEFSRNFLFDIEQIGVIIKSLSIISNIRSLVSPTKSNIVRFDISSLLIKTNTLISSILKGAVKSGVFNYDIRKETVDANTIRYNITNTLEIQRSFIFQTLKGIAKQNSIVFQTLQSILPIPKSATLKYNVIKETTKAENLLYQINQFTEQSISINSQIYQKAEQDVSVRYDLISEIGKSLAIQQNIFQELTKQNDLLFRITQEIPDISKSINFDIISQTTKLLRTLHDIRQVFDYSRTLVFNVLPQGVTPKISLHEQLLDYIISQWSISSPSYPTVEKILWHDWYNGQADICIKSLFYNHFTIENRSTPIYKERNYSTAIHIFYRDYSDVLPQNRNVPQELANIIREVQRILLVNRYNLYYEFRNRNVFDMKIKSAKFVPEETIDSTNRIWHYRFIVEMYYQKII